MSYGCSNSTPDARERTNSSTTSNRVLARCVWRLETCWEAPPIAGSVRSAVSVPVLARTHRGVAPKTKSLDLSPERRSGPVRIAHRRNRAHLPLRACRLNAVFFRLHDRSDQSAVLLGSDDGNRGARFQQTRICGHIVSYGYVGAHLNRLLSALVGHR
jgi:hypothetical protein